MTLVDNPILPGCHPDPSICRVDGTYYLVTSTFEYFPGLPIFASTDLADWELIGHVVTRPEQLDYAGIASSGGLYAPTLRYHDGRFWVVCTLVDQQDASRGGNFVMTATDPSGPWSDPVWLDVTGIDPSVFFDDDGRVWLHGTRLAAEPEWHDQTEVWVREFDPVAMALIGPETVIWTGAVRGAVWAEGPHLYRVDDTYYLLAAEGGTEFHHAVSVARADAVTGPYVGNPANPVLTHRQLGREVDVVGAGHADLVQAPDGSWWALLLAMRPYGGYHYNLGRETNLLPVVWQDGWPVFAPGVGRIPAQVELPTAAAAARGPEQGGASGLVLPSDPRWTSLRGPASAFAEPEGVGWRLRLRPATLAEAGTPAFLGLRQQHRKLNLRVTLRAPIAAGEEAGIVVRQSELDHVRLLVRPDADGCGLIQAIHRRGGVETVLGECATAAPVGDRLVLAVEIRDQAYALDAQLDGGPRTRLGVIDGRQLDSVATGGFLGLWLGVYATSNGVATTSTVVVESVEYVPD